MSGFDFNKALGAGVEGVDKSVLGQPFLQILQPASPEINGLHQKHAEKKIDGAKAGDVIFVPERKVIPAPIPVIALNFVSAYTEWKPRSAGGGFVGHQLLSVIGQPNYKKGRPGTPDEFKEWLGENELKYTTYTAVRFKDGDKWKDGIIPFSATQLKEARIWQKKILGVRHPALPDAQAPVFSAVWKFTTKANTNDKGGWYGWNIELDRLLDATTDQALLEESFVAHKETKEQALRLSAGAAPEALPEDGQDRPF